MSVRSSRRLAPDRAWLELPVIAGGDDPLAVRPKYDVDGNALLIYRDGKAYVTYRGAGGNRLASELTSQPDVRLLTAAESRSFEERLPFALPAATDRARVRLGDVVHRLTRRLPVAHCSSCQQRKRVLNRIVVWGWWRRPSGA